MFELLHVINTWKNENANVSHIFFARKHESDLNKSGKRVQYKLYTRDFEIVLKTGNCSLNVISYLSSAGRKNFYISE